MKHRSLLTTTYVAVLFLITLLQSTPASAQLSPSQRLAKYPGNTVVNYIASVTGRHFFTDPVDDTIRFRKVADDLYTDATGKIYLLTEAQESWKDTTVFIQYYKDLSKFMDLNSYKPIKDGYFVNKGKVYIWWGDNTGKFPVEVKGADPKTFIPFENVCGGKDDRYVFFGSPATEIKAISGASPANVKVLRPERSCWNCMNCYFTDGKNVYYGFTKLVGADAATFTLANQDNVDATDKNRKYFDGAPIK